MYQKVGEETDIRGRVFNRSVIWWLSAKTRRHANGPPRLLATIEMIGIFVFGSDLALFYAIELLG